MQLGKFRLFRWVGWYFSLPLIKALWIGALVALLLWISLGFYRGSRYPTLQLEPQASVTEWHKRDSNWKIKADGAFFDKFHRSEVARARAYIPEPSVVITSGDDGNALLLTIYNIHPDATLSVLPDRTNVEENVYGINRQLVIRPDQSSQIQLRWKLPNKNHYRLAVIGDSGAGTELQWLLNRSAELGADFFVLLGDLFYSHDHVRTAREVLDRSPIPVFVVVGNHDFRGHWRAGFELPLAYVRQIGPRNYSFTLNDRKFIAIDTAAATFPAWGGERGTTIRRALSENDSGEGSKKINENLFFGHRPVSDDSVEHEEVRDRSVRSGEKSWLISKMKKFRNPILVFGHIHKSLTYTVEGIKAYVAGEGLALVNLLNTTLEAQILMIDLETNQPAQFQWNDIAMPKSYHCGKNIIDALAPEHTEIATNLENLCLQRLTGHVPEHDPTH